MANLADPPPEPVKPDSPTPDKRNLTVWDVIGHLKIPDAGKFLLATFALLGGAYSLGASHPRWNSSSVAAASVVASSAPPGLSKTYYGYYADFKADGTTPTINDETLSFEFLPDSKLKATSTAEISTKHGRIPKVWEYVGFQKGSRMSMTYSTVPTKDDPFARGVGVLMLEQLDSSEYTGTAVYLDCGRGLMLQCPYALTEQHIDVGDAKSRWPRLFQRACVATDLVPDRVQSATGPTSCPVLASN